MPKMLVTGATGKLGSKVVEHLLKRVPARDVAALVRHPAKAARLREAGVETRAGDYEDVDSLVRAFDGIDRLLVISSGGPDLLDLYTVSPDEAEKARVRQHGNAFEAAKRAGVSFLAYTSLPKADTSTMFVADVHRTSEAMVRKSGIPFSVLRNNWYIENAVEEIAVIPAAIEGQPIVTAAGAGRIGWVLREELAEAAANVLAHADRHQNTVYELAGESVTYDELAAALGQVLGRDVPVRHVDDATYGELIDALVRPPLTTTAAEVAFQAEVRQGLLDVRASDLEHALGRRPSSLVETLRAVVGRLQQR